MLEGPEPSLYSPVLHMFMDFFAIKPMSSQHGSSSCDYLWNPVGPGDELLISLCCRPKLYSCRSRPHTLAINPISIIFTHSIAS